MAIPYVIQWFDGVPEQLRAGMLIFWPDGVELIGSVEEGVIPEPDCGIIRWAWAIKPSELEWAISMASRR